jgi:glucose/arabinose dehydrogenase
VAWLGCRFEAAPRRRLLLAVALVLAGCGSSSSSPPATHAGPVPIGAGLRGPAGMAASVYATGLPAASAFALDARGRLWVATSAATDHRQDGVYLVARTGARPVKVISGVRGPLGLTWVGHRLYVASLGRVDAWSGLHGTHFARRRTILVEPAGHGWNNGMVQARDGRLVMGISSACDHCTSRSQWSASIVSFRPDGKDVRLYARNIRAPFGLAYVPGTTDLLVTMNQRDDLGTRTPGDWLGLVREGQDWRFPRCHGQSEAGCAGVPAPIAELARHAAAGGVAVVSGRALVAEWQRGRILGVALSRTATGYRAGTATAWVTGLRNPLPVIVTPTGAVLVGDWGTGRIYRIAKS